MPWFLTSPGHKQPWYWLHRICRSFSYLRKALSTCVISMWRNDTECKCMFMFPLKNLARKGLSLNVKEDVNLPIFTKTRWRSGCGIWEMVIPQTFDEFGRWVFEVCRLRGWRQHSSSCGAGDGSASLMRSRVTDSSPWMHHHPHKNLFRVTRSSVVTCDDIEIKLYCNNTVDCCTRGINISKLQQVWIISYLPEILTSLQWRHRSIKAS